jgi:muramoyltetrapeptide carboxypeptidase
MIKIIKPPKLSKGDVIGVVATSFPFPFPEDTTNDYYIQYIEGIEELENMGFKTKEGRNLRKVKWWYAGKPEERAEDINSMYSDSEVKAIIVHDGGQSAIAVLEHLDFELVKEHPKPFLGFSDVTNIHISLYAKTGLVGFHAALLTYSLGRVWEQYLPDKKETGKRLLLNALTSTKPLGKMQPLTNWECWRKGQAIGTLFGGNLSMLSNLIGTKYFPAIEDLRDSILFWEIDNSPSYRIERSLYQLKYAGVFETISGMMVGKLPDLGRTAWKGLAEPTPKEIVLEVLKGYDFPILGEMDFGHKTVDMPMPIGLQVKMNSRNLGFEILESAVR